jgi:plastocyanin
MNRRRFVAVTSVTATSVLLVACGNEPLSEEALNPTQIPDVPGAPPTIAPRTSTPGAQAQGDAPAEEEGTAAASGDTGDAGAAAAEAIVIEAHDDFSFTPNEVEVAPGQTITLHNKGFAQHDLVVDEWGIATELLNSEQTGDVTIPEDVEVGVSVTFYCSVPGHRQSGMEGTFTVVEASAAAAPAGEEAPAEEAAPAEEGSAGGAAEAIVIEAHDDFSFTPNEVEVSPGQTITLHNKGFAQHDLVVDEWGIATELLNSEQTGDVVIPDDVEVGSSVTFYCSVPGHRQSGMEGTFTVVEGGSSAAAAPAGETEEESTAAAEEEAPAAAGSGTSEPILIEAHDDFSFSPNEVEVSPGQTVTLHNKGFAQHDLVVDEWGIATELLNNEQSGDVVIPDDVEVGSSVEFYCSVPGHKQSGMVGTFTVVEGGSTQAAPAGETEAEGESTAAVEEEAPAVAGSGSGEPIMIEAHDDFSFSPSEVEVAPGQTITLHNMGFAQHDLVVDEWGIATELLNNDQTGDVVIPDDVEVGSSVEFYCSVPGHKQSGMVGTFTVVEGGSSAAAPTGDGEATAAAGEAGSGSETGGMENTPQAVTVVGTQWEFQPAEFEIAPGGVITFQNETGMSMGLTSEEWDKDALTPMIKSVPNGSFGEFAVPEDAPVGETIEFKSNLTEAQNQGMVGKITIVAPSAGSATPAASPQANEGEGEAGGTGEAILIEAHDDFSFSPNEVEVSAGQTVTLQNLGFAQHDLVVDEWDIRTELLNNDESGDVVIPEDVESGSSVEFYCSVPGHKQSGMVGTFTVK